MASLTQTASAWAPRMLSVLRIVTGLLFLQHGTMKYFNFPPSEMFAGGLDGLMRAAGAIELVGGILIIIGLFTRPVGFICSGFTAAAYFMAHAPQGFFPALNGGELAALYCFVFLYFAAMGSGRWSLDALRTRGRRR